MFQLWVLALAAICGAVIAQSTDTRIAFTGYPKAQTSVGQSAIILSGSQPSGMQILYKKLVTDNRLAPLVTVYLYHPKTNSMFPLQHGFDTIGQACSCYWIGAPDLGRRFAGQGLFASQSWTIRFLGGNMDLISGEFGIGWGNNLIEGQLASDVFSQQQDPADPPVLILNNNDKVKTTNNNNGTKNGTSLLKTGDSPVDSKVQPKSNAVINCIPASLFMIVTFVVSLTV